MHTKEIGFILPIGYKDENGDIHRQGKMRLATAIDEIEMSEDESVGFNKRYADIKTLSLVITQLGKYNSLSTEMLVGLNEIDFIYLQSLYNELNSKFEAKSDTKCPHCNSINNIDLANIYEHFDFYLPKKPMEQKSDILIQEITNPSK